MGRGILLDELRAVALPVELERVGVEVVADRLEVLDGLGGRVQRQVGFVDAGFLDAVGHERLGRLRGVVTLGRHLDPRRRRVVGRGRVRALDRLGQADPALVHEHDVVGVRDGGPVVVGVAVRGRDPAGAGAAGDR